MGKKVATVAACLIAIAIGVYFAWPKSPIPTINPDDWRRPWVCDDCGHTFLEPPGGGMHTCPKCTKTAGVQSIIYACKCGHDFEAYRLKDYSSTDKDVDENGKPVVPTFYFKKPGGKWTTQPKDLEPSACPKCGNTDKATLQEKRFGPLAGY